MPDSVIAKANLQAMLQAASTNSASKHGASGLTIYRSPARGSAGSGLPQARRQQLRVLSAFQREYGECKVDHLMRAGVEFQLKENYNIKNEEEAIHEARLHKPSNEIAKAREAACDRIVEGNRMLRQAIAADLLKLKRSGDDDSEKAQSEAYNNAAEFVAGLPFSRASLTPRNLVRARDFLENAGAGTSNLDALTEVVNLERKISVSLSRLEQVNNAIEKAARRGRDHGDILDGMKDHKGRLKELADFYKGGKLDNMKQRGVLSAGLRDDIKTLSEWRRGLDVSRPGERKLAGLLSKQIAGLHDLALALPDPKSQQTQQLRQSVDFGKALDGGETLLDIADGPLQTALTPPKTLYKSWQARKGAHKTLKAPLEQYNETLKAAATALKIYRASNLHEDLHRLEKAVSQASILNDHVSYIFKALDRNRLFGFSTPQANLLKAQRETLQALNATIPQAKNPPDTGGYNYEDDDSMYTEESESEFDDPLDESDSDVDVLGFSTSRQARISDAGVPPDSPLARADAAGASRLNEGEREQLERKLAVSADQLRMQQDDAEVYLAGFDSAYAGEIRDLLTSCKETAGEINEFNSSGDIDDAGKRAKLAEKVKTSFHQLILAQQLFILDDRTKFQDEPPSLSAFSLSRHLQLQLAAVHDLALALLDPEAREKFRTLAGGLLNKKLPVQRGVSDNVEEMKEKKLNARESLLVNAAIRHVSKESIYPPFVLADEYNALLDRVVEAYSNCSANKTLETLRALDEALESACAKGEEYRTLKIGTEKLNKQQLRYWKNILPRVERMDSQFKLLREQRETMQLFRVEIAKQMHQIGKEPASDRSIRAANHDDIPNLNVLHRAKTTGRILEPFLPVLKEGIEPESETDDA